MKKVDSFILMDHFNNSMETIKQYALDSAKRRGEMLEHIVEDIEVVLKKYKNKRIKKYEVTGLGSIRKTKYEKE